MLLQELGRAIRLARTAQGLTQAQLAADAGVSRNTLNRVENGVFPDLGVRKVEAILERLGMKLKPVGLKQEKPDFVGMACATASVSLKEPLAPQELVQAMLSGKVPTGKEAHLITLLDEGPPVLLDGLVAQVGSWVKPGKVNKNLQELARSVGLVAENGAWHRTG
jgi:transcriptional regulator with XRE-family HTH domain